MTASARKTKYGYKPVVVHPGGRTEVVGLRFRLTEDGRDMRRASGRRFEVRSDAIAYAQKIINNREKHRAERV